MNKKNTSFEEALRSLKPHPPSPELKARIAAQVPRHQEGAPREPEHLVFFPSPLLRIAATLFLSLCATLLIWKILPGSFSTDPAHTESTPKMQRAGVFQPVSARRELVRQEDEGIVRIDGSEPHRKMRYYTVNHMEWRNPDDGRRFTIITPQETVVFVKITVY